MDSRGHRRGAGAAGLAAKSATMITATAALLAVPALASASTAAPAVSARGTAVQSLAMVKHSSRVIASAAPGVAVAGTRVMLSATISTAGPMPNGWVNFWLGGRDLCSGRVYHRTARCAVEFRSVGLYHVRAIYSGDGSHAGAVGWLWARATRAATRTGIYVSTARPYTGQAVLLTAVVSSNSPLVPIGWVMFSDANGNLCSGRVINGSAHCVYRWTKAGQYAVTARYGGDGAHYGSVRTSGTITVITAPPKVVATTTVITSITGIINGVPTPHRDLAGNPATVTVTVTSNAAGFSAPTGTVKVFPNVPAIAALSGYSCTATLTAGTGTCTVTPAAGSFGDINYNATYSGDATHAASTYTGGYLLVVPDTTATAVTFNPAAGTVGTPDTITATVTDPVSGNISPSVGGTGTVTFSIGGTPVSAACTNVPLTFVPSAPGAKTGVNTATCSYTPTAAGSVTVTATYSGDPANLGSSGNGTLTSS